MVMELLFWGIQVAISIIILVLIFRKREEDEKYLGWKLFGYCFLAAFTFRINNFPIPLGFLIYLLFIHPKVNKVAKRRAVLLGLVFFLIGAGYPSVEKYSFERPREIAVASVNVYQLGFSEEWKKLQEKLNIPEDARLVFINIAFASDGKLKTINGDFIGMKGNEIIMYSIEYDPITNKNKIIRQKSTQQNVPNYYELVTMTRLFQVVDCVKEKNMLPHTTLNEYSIHAEGRMDIGKMTYENVCFIENDGTVKMVEYETLPSGLPLIMVNGSVNFGEEFPSEKICYYYP